MKKAKSKPTKPIPRVCAKCVHEYAAHATAAGAKADRQKQHLARLQTHLGDTGFGHVAAKTLHTTFTRLAEGKHPGGLSHRTLRVELNRAGLEHVPAVIAYRVLKLSTQR